MGNRLLIFVAFALSITTIFSETIHAQGNPEIDLSLTTPELGGRAFSPVHVTAEINWNDVVTQGRLELYFNDDFTMITSPIVLAPGKKIFTMLLPPFYNENPYVPVRAVFRADEKSFPLGSHNLQIPQRNKRVLTILSNRPQSYDRIPLARLIRVEQFEPSSSSNSIVTLFFDLDSGRFPCSPFEYFLCDLIVIYGEELSVFSNAQLEAIVAWVEMGGSLLISIPDHVLLHDAQLKFLSDIAGIREIDAQDSSVARYSSMAFFKKNTTIKTNRGLGRVVIHKRATDDIGIYSRERLEIASFLWKFTKIQSDEIVKEGKWRLDTEVLDISLHGFLRRSDAYSTRNMYRGIENMYAWGNHPLRSYIDFRLEYLQKPLEMKLISYRTIPMANESTAFEWFLPERIRSIPAWLLVLTLLTFLLITGPIDYYILGFLKKRVLTWVSFPLMTLLFLFLAMKMADFYMGSSSVKKYIEIVDLGSDNRILRTNRLSMFIFPRPQELNLSCKNTIFTVVPYTQLKNYSISQNVWNDRTVKPVASMIEGAIPFSFTVKQNVSQWDPLIVREFFISRETSNLKVDINFEKLKYILREITPDNRIKANNSMEELGSSYYRQKYKQTATISGTIEPTDIRNYAKKQPAVQPVPGLDSAISFKENFNGSIYVFHRYYVYTLMRQKDSIHVDPFLEISRRQQIGYFSVFSRISPNGDSSFEDLSILDPTDYNQYLVVFVTEKEGNIYVYRRLFIIGRDS